MENTSLGGELATAVPTREDLRSHGSRHLAGASLAMLAAGIVNRGGYLEQRWLYVAVAAALLWPAIVNAVAMRDPGRRRRLRTSSRPTPVLLGLALLLAAGAADLLLTGAGAVPAVAGLCAALGLGIAGAPTTVRLAPRR